MASNRRSFDETMRWGANALAGFDTAIIDARVLLKAAAGLDDAALIARSQDDAPEKIKRVYAGYIERRRKCEPVAYITGEQEFWSLPFRVTPDVLIPRRDSEALIEAVLQRRPPARAYSILDLGVGSGCLLCALLHEFRHSAGLGVDISGSALAVARENARRLGLADRAKFVRGDWASALSGLFDILIANPPYIDDQELQGLAPDVADFEPVSALRGGADGMDPYRAIIGAAPDLMAEDGLIVLEISHGRQAALVAERLSQAFPHAACRLVNDLGGRVRAVAVDLKSLGKRD